ncbi:MAG TPA: CcmD family protein [Candidatus Acidoferrales bacterium]|nr:CcmD family protein [Candidatus Acidoferrales bacterium]
MRDFHFLFAAWTAAWVIFFAYEISVGARLARLRKEIEQLKKQIRGR